MYDNKCSSVNITYSMEKMWRGTNIGVTPMNKVIIIHHHTFLIFPEPRAAYDSCAYVYIFSRVILIGIEKSKLLSIHCVMIWILACKTLQTFIPWRMNERLWNFVRELVIRDFQIPLIWNYIDNCGRNNTSENPLQNVVHGPNIFLLWSHWHHIHGSLTEQGPGLPRNFRFKSPHSKQELLNLASDWLAASHQRPRSHVKKLY